MDFFVNADGSYMYMKNRDVEKMTEAEKAAFAKGQRVIKKIDDTNPEMIEHALRGRCRGDKDGIVVKPENEWPENISAENAQ